MSRIGKNIKKARAEKGYTQEQLAQKLSVTRNTISNYETGCTHPYQKRPGREDADDDQRDAGDQADRYGGMHIIPGSFVISVSESQCHIDVGTDGKPDEQVGEQVDNCSCGTDSSQRRISSKAADYNDIGGIKEKLKTAGQH